MLIGFPFAAEGYSMNVSLRNSFALGQIATL
jgi:hypothetical protein